MTNLAAQITATFHVFNQRMRTRLEQGQTTAEYVGIIAFVAIMVVLLFAFGPEIAEAAKGIITTAFEHISGSIG